ncbi:LytR/AlgR family response regulator transcription factor [Pedobacter frigoris]|uniref:Response regulator n=1 Tax=Pedobacter frigoris TaxID=2571272 RepID=A0A4U1CDS4_9SPHI|nr:LytTR family transcriptional regulator DNA-binding domain-containing protein [Pedobacter frigoris]TKC04364.1 response regulator [Pedobacter frigoris]
MSTKLRSIIIDDERPARLMMSRLAGNYPDVLEIIAEASNAIEAIELIDNLKPDLIFLDVHMPDLNGFDMLTRLRHKPLVIFTTAFEQYAIRAFQENTLDYLVKPIEDSRFMKSIEKIKRWNNSNMQVDFLKLKEIFDQMQPKKEATALPVKVKDKILLVRFPDLVYLESQLGYVTLYTDNGTEYLSELSLSDLEEKLPANFIRVQKSFIINKDKIGEISKHFNNRLIITMTDKKQSRITTGTTYIQQIRAELDL